MAMKIKDICACKRVEWQWSYAHDARFGTAVCYDCRKAIAYTSVNNFVERILRDKLTYVETPFAFMNAIGSSTSAASRRAASSR